MAQRKRINRRSIVTVFITFGIVGFILVFCTFIGMYSFFQKQNDTQKAFINRVSLANDIIVALEDSKNSLTQYRHGWEELYYEKYAQNLEVLNGKVAIYLENENHYLEENYQTIRRLSNFLAYQESMILEAKPNATALYNVTSYLLTGFADHQDQVFKVMESDLQNGYDEYFREEAKNLRNMIQILIGFVVSLGLLILLFIRYQHELLTYLDKVTENLHRISHHEWNVEDMPEDTYQEFQELSTSVNEMKNRLHEYFLKMEKQSETERQLAVEQLRNEQQRVKLIRAQMDTLKSQINPHFLFNALHQIGMASLVEEPKVILELVEATGKILRYSLYNKDSMVPLQDELEIVSTYVFLQRQYSGRTIHFHLDISEDAEDVLVMPMCIQPIVENSFKHGLSTVRDRDWELHLKGEVLQDGSLEVSIRDNGVGLTEKRNDKRSGIGLHNIKRRLELQYGRDDLLAIATEKDKYTEIILTFPAEEKAL